MQAMWEDNKTRSKWVFVNRCYFPNDLPEADGRPCSPESNEVVVYMHYFIYFDIYVHLHKKAIFKKLAQV